MAMMLHGYDASWLEVEALMSQPAAGGTYTPLPVLGQSRYSIEEAKKCESRNQSRMVRDMNDYAVIQALQHNMCLPVWQQRLCHLWLPHDQLPHDYSCLDYGSSHVHFDKTPVQNRFLSFKQSTR